MPSDLHEDRLDQVAAWLAAANVSQVLDLGCGSGSLLQRLVRNPRFERIVGIEQSGMLLHQAKINLAPWLDNPPGRLQLRLGSYADPALPLSGFAAATMIETIEHVDPGQLSQVERAVFGFYQPDYLIMTTPNVEYNPIFGLGPGEKRDPDHRFEWSRAKFQSWCTGIARRHNYTIRFSGIGEADDELGAPTQVAHFARVKP